MFKHKTSHEWVSMLNEMGVPCGPIYSMDQVFADPQVQHLQAATPVDHPSLGRINILNQAARLSRTPSSMAAATPEQGAHNDEVLTEIGYSASDIQALRAARVI